MLTTSNLKTTTSSSSAPSSTTADSPTVRAPEGRRRVEAACESDADYKAALYSSRRLCIYAALEEAELVFVERDEHVLCLASSATMKLNGAQGKARVAMQQMGCGASLRYG